MNDQVDGIRVIKEGLLDLSDEVLGELDVVVGSKARSIVVTGTRTIDEDEFRKLLGL